MPSPLLLPPSVVCQVPCMSVVLSLVPGGGVASVADPPGGLVHGAGAGALDAAASFAPRAHRAAAGAAFDAPGALALGAGAERAPVQPPDAGGDDGEHGQDEMGAHGGSPVLAAGRAGGIPGCVPVVVTLGVALVVTGAVALGVALGVTFDLAVVVAIAVALLVDAAGEPLAGPVAAGLVPVLLTCIGQPSHGVLWPSQDRP